ncbi:MAG: hypothetical protein CVV02_10460 [Firmicutes bacterium HGW-Firmicutes-7]|nr:MAG: hypothetical protein CVV02_10460 [Firmicutes bacterium HGW-Firmicutes-7]
MKNSPRGYIYHKYLCSIEWITTLAIGISEYVTPRVKKQQEFEVQINAYTTKYELDSVVINYDGIVN